MENFNFWCPIDKIEKAIDPSTGKEIMRLGGIASTIDEDSDGECLDPNGFDLKMLLEKGVVNWHHQAKDKPAAIIGEPHIAEIRENQLYVETDLYPSSKIATDVYSLAETLNRDSKTRKLGYSIEGKVIKRKSEDRKNPDYKKIEKAMITGLAVTYMPKNPKSFVDIIKGEIDNLEEMENTNIITEKSLSKIDIYKSIFSRANVGIRKAKNIYKIISNIADMSKKEITEEEINKAFEILDIVKSVDSSEKDDKNKEEVDNKENKEVDNKENKEVDNKEEEEKEEEEKEEEKGKNMNKGESENIFEKSIQSSLKTQEMIQATGVLIKDLMNKIEKNQENLDNLKDIIKSQEENISKMGEELQKVSEYTPEVRSVRHSYNIIDRNFLKSEENEFEKAAVNTLSISKQKSKVLSLLDSMTFEKGFNEEMSNACLSFESSGILPEKIIESIKAEKGINIIR